MRRPAEPLQIFFPSITKNPHSVNKWHRKLMPLLLPDGGFLIFIEPLFVFPCCLFLYFLKAILYFSNSAFYFVYRNAISSKRSGFFSHHASNFIPESVISCPSSAKNASTSSSERTPSRSPIFSLFWRSQPPYVN